ncbi:MAG: diversity-generating retroelement protein Avd [Desulfobacterales bacterium]|uniref:Diversity-generating retroelement protein Avd n=1 Tax=Candidatus Desulfaltia bathyphila TaxID=2841697 RepID=A0A8J6N6V8_9BACT|nr:diversity-generating retroelement protein Avd [Candidatus Desulfaltia bathyphila]MBL7208108.1 diversity-generating retroelement protein Avd [Desulfobacterales bacterium]
MAKKTGPDSLTLTYDLLKWSIPAIKSFPRDQRFMLGDRIENHILDVLELLISARYSRDKIDCLKKANLKIEVLRFLWRLSLDLNYLNSRRYEHVSVLMNDIGRLIGSWIKYVKARDEKIRQPVSPGV